MAHNGDLWRLGENPVTMRRCHRQRRRSACVRRPSRQHGLHRSAIWSSYGNHGGAPKQGRRPAIQNDELGAGFYDFRLAACQNLLSFTDGAVYVCMSSSELHTLQKAFVDAGGHWSTLIT